MIAKMLRENRRALIGWSVGISLFIAMYVGIYASVMENPEVYGQAALAKYPGALRDLMGGMEDFTTGAGYLQSVVYQLFVPLLCTVCAMIMANRAIAGPEESGTLELTLALPLARTRLLLQRYAGVLIGLLVVTLVTLLMMLAVTQGLGMGVGVDRILAAHLGVFLLAAFFATVTLTVGAATGSKGLGMGVMGVWAVAGYMVVTVGRNVEAISWLKWVSPWHYYAEGRPLYTGLPAGDYALLAGATLVLALTAVLAFDRRDVGV